MEDIGTMFNMQQKEKTRELQADIATHNYNVSQVSIVISEGLNLPAVEKHIISCTAYYHDIGKGMINQDILYKRGKYNDAEFLEIKKHAKLGANSMKHNPHLRPYADYVLYHHEDYNGGGYFGLKGARIPFQSRVIRVADYFDALCEIRSYRDACTIEEALEIMLSENEKFDPKIFENFIQTLKDKDILERLRAMYEKSNAESPFLYD